MQHCSDSVGTLAAALAKAQLQLKNPEKCLRATIVSPFTREGTRTFRYASLSSGLDLIRKCLGEYEIATLQTTAIDKDSGLICLTTTLVHASGEWISSLWPVCPSSETAAPHRLGAALTYARRYALFTLVGIAGDDDLDAPDLNPVFELAAGQNYPATSELKTEGKRETQARSPRDQRHGKSQPSRAILLGDKDSEELRDKLISELELLGDFDSLGDWAQRALPLKSQLLTQHAERIEATFSARLHQLSGEAGGADQADARENSTKEFASAGKADAVVSIRKPIRERDRNHLRFVATQPCLICGRTPTDAHHVKFAQLTAMGRRVSDRFTVPICRLHHRELHRRGAERDWWSAQNIDPLPIAAALWACTHADEPRVVEPADHASPPMPFDRPELPFRDRNDKTNPILSPEAR
jgi:hypothetical protein